jgi:hypothetical protein
MRTPEGYDPPAGSGRERRRAAAPARRARYREVARNPRGDALYTKAPVSSGAFVIVHGEDSEVPTEWPDST